MWFSIRLEMTFSWSSLRTLNRMARLSLSFFSRNRPLSLSSGDGGALRSSDAKPSSGTLQYAHKHAVISQQHKTTNDLQKCDAPFSLFTDTSLAWLLCVPREVQRQHESAPKAVHVCMHTLACACADVHVLVRVCSAAS